MNLLIKAMTKRGLFTKDLDYHLLRASMVIVFIFFGYQKWFGYEAQASIPTAHLFFGCIPFSASKVRVCFWVSRNGSSGLCCSLVSGTRNWESLELLAHVFHS
jgi:hypothetical protein